MQQGKLSLSTGELSDVRRELPRSRRPRAHRANVAHRGLEWELPAEYRALKRLQFSPWLEAEFVDQPVTQRPKGCQRVGLAAGTKQSQHQVAVQSFPQRVSRNLRGELGNQLMVATERQVRLDPVLQDGESTFLQSSRLSLGDRPARAAERRASPQIQRVAQAFAGICRPTLD